MTAALYSSRPSGSKKLTCLDGGQLKRSSQRGISRKVPGLKYAYVYRNNWTRLNVRPAKIMQVIEIYLFIIKEVVCMGPWKVLEF